VATTYHIRIKKEYAAAVIEDLQKMDAVELMNDEDAFDIPQWQKDEVRRRIEKYKNNSGQLIDEDSFFKMLDAD
jgi:Putative addiction module component